MTDHVNVAGIYALNLTVNGELKTIIVDDYVPVDWYNRPAFSTTASGNAWVMLLEKAWAKLNGSYESIISGTCKEAFTFVTPFIARNFHTLPGNDEDKDIDMWDWIVIA